MKDIKLQVKKILFVMIDIRKKYKLFIEFRKFREEVKQEEEYDYVIKEEFIQI